MEEKREDIIDISEILGQLIKRKKVYFKTLPIVFVLACIYIICIPRSYNTNARLAPELGTSLTGGSLGTLASSIGLNMFSSEMTDAISPLLYPDLMEDNGFVMELLSITVKSEDGEINCSYSDYLKLHQKRPWWASLIRGVVGIFKFGEDKHGMGGGENDPYYLSRNDNDIVEMVRSSIALSVDKKTGVITISTEAQDPLVCKILADSVTVHLQRFITDYRTNKARIDLEYYRNLVKEAKENYESAIAVYGSFSDANADVILEEFRLKQSYLENEMQLRLNTYSALDAQFQAALAKLQERTPAFTTLKGANVPIKPSKPKRMIFVLSMLFLTCIADTLYILKDRLLKKRV